MSDPRLTERRAADVCVCCGAPEVLGSSVLECGCRFCWLCARRGHDSHDASAFHVPCPAAVEVPA